MKNVQRFVFIEPLFMVQCDSPIFYPVLLPLPLLSKHLRFLKATWQSASDLQKFTLCSGGIAGIYLYTIRVVSSSALTHCSSSSKHQHHILKVKRCGLAISYPPDEGEIVVLPLSIREFQKIGLEG